MVRRYSKPHGHTRWVIIAFVVFAAIVGALVLRKYDVSSRPQTPPTVESVGMLLVTLFFADGSGGGLVREGREIDAGTDLAESVETVIEELISGPVGDFEPVLPYNTLIRGVEITGDEAIVDFGREIVDGLPGGSASEMAAVFAVTDTVTINFPQIKKVQFLIDGAKVSTLKGHVDIHQPLAPDYSLEKRP